MHFVYGFCDGNAAEAAREYRRRNPNRRTPQPHTFTNVSKYLNNKIIVFVLITFHILKVL